MLLSELLARSSVQMVAVEGDAEVSSATLDSRKGGEGVLFVCRQGRGVDAEGFLGSSGASAAIVHSEEGLKEAQRLGVAAALIPMEARPDAEWRLMDTLYDHPSRHMKVVGITGTNGKTSVAWFLRDILTALGLKTGYLGTLGFQVPGIKRELSNTTPYAVELYGLLAEARDAGVEALAMEVSSHALAEKRCDGVEFDAAVFTNLTQDHLDLHGSMEEYTAAKKRLFTELPRQTSKAFVGAINVGDPVGLRWSVDMADQRPIRYSMVPNLGQFGACRDDLDLEGKTLEVGLQTVHIVTQSHFAGDVGLVTRLGGAYNAENLLSAIAGVAALGLPIDGMSEWGADIRPVPGRFEPVPNDRDLDVIVDYAHTPDAVAKLLQAVRPLARGQVIVVLGCGGDRDAKKRPLMAQAAVAGSDYAILTSDNPRTEDPERILDDMVDGLTGDFHRISDRREAIGYAIAHSAPGDAVVIAGKGHETYQIIGREKTPFDDRQVAREWLA